MVKFLQLSFLLLIFFIVAGSANAQTENNFKKVEQVNNNSSIGIKPKSNSSDILEKTSTINSTESQQKVLQSETNIENKTSQESTNQSLENIPVDYSQMPLDVQLKISENKIAGRPSLDWIEKAFMVEINSCLNSESTQNILSFLNGQTGFIRSEFVSTGVVRIIVSPDLKSEDLKEKMLAMGINFNFLNEYYLVKK